MTTRKTADGRINNTEKLGLSIDKSKRRRRGDVLEKASVQ